MPSFRQTPLTPTPPSPSRAATAQWAAGQRLFFELPHILNPRPFTGYFGVGPFNHQAAGVSATREVVEDGGGGRGHGGDVVCPMLSGGGAALDLDVSRGTGRPADGSLRLQYG